MGDSIPHFDALMSAWYPGLQGAPAAASVIFGQVSPAGRTAVTWCVHTHWLLKSRELHTGGGREKEKVKHAQEVVEKLRE